MRRSKEGFTLLEVLLSLALAALLLVALNTFIFSMGELWGKNSERRLFDQHVNAVGRFLTEELREATLPPSARASATPVSVQEITPANGAIERLITFELPSGCRLLAWPDRPLPEVVCSLQLREHAGLFLLWHSRLETRFDTDPPRETLLTPWASALAYDNYDTTHKRWTKEMALRNGTNNQPQVPQRLRLTFSYGKMAREIVIPLPLAQQGLPNF